MQNLAQHYQKFSGQPKLHGTLLQKQNNWMPIIPVLLRQRQMALCEFKVRLVYTVSSNTASATHCDSVSTCKKIKQIQTNKQQKKTKIKVIFIYI